MKTAVIGSRALGIGLAVVMLAGCGGSQPPIGAPGALPQRGAIRSGSPVGTLNSQSEEHGWLSSAAMNGQPLVYIADNDRIQIVPERPHKAHRIGEITDGISEAQGLWVDRHGSLYVANGRSGTVTVYTRGSLTPSITYSGLNGPKYVVVDHPGNVFVSNSDGTVTEFLRGITSPYRTWKTPGTQADGVDLDRRGNLYVAYRDSSNSYGSVEKIRPHSSSKQGRILGMPVNQPQGLVRTRSGTFLAVATGFPEVVDVFPPNLRQTCQVVGVPDIPTELVITGDEQRLFVAGWYSIWVAPMRKVGGGCAFGPVSLFHSKIGLRKYPRGVAGVALSNGQAF